MRWSAEERRVRESSSEDDWLPFASTTSETLVVSTKEQIRGEEAQSKHDWREVVERGGALAVSCCMAQVWLG